MSRKTKTQKGIKIEHTIIPGVGHFFEDKNEDLKQIVGDYVDKRMIEIEKAKREAE
jgi:alpha/beta superfamily hydrolase